MITEDQILTLVLETRDGLEGIWLCADNGIISVPLAQFISEDSTEIFTKAYNLNFSKGYAMGKMGL